MAVNLTTISCARTPPSLDPVPPPAEVRIEPSPAEPRLVPPGDAEGLTLIGRWEGVGKQDSGPTWPMTLTIDTLARGECAKVEYPSIPCSGYWTCTSASDGFVLEGVEVITEGNGLCHSGIPVMVRLARDRQSLRFVVEAGVDSAEANLHRTARPELSPE